MRDDLAGCPVRTAHPAATASGAERASRVRAMFAGIAPRYDLANRVLSLGLDAGWRRAVVRSLALMPGDWCLDSCCGTGDLGLELLRSEVRVIGVDFCRPMLRGAQGKDSEHELRLAEGDALRLPLRSGAVNAACVAFGLRNLVDPAGGLAEMARVVRPGGRVAVLEFSQPPGVLARWAHRVHVGRVLPWLGDLVSGVPGTYRYLPETIGSWFDPESLAAMMRGVGLVDVTFRRLALGAVALHVGVRDALGKGREDAAC